MKEKGSYDDEPASFDQMEQFTFEMGLTGVSKIHREIYLTDAKKNSSRETKNSIKVQCSVVILAINPILFDNIRFSEYSLAIFIKVGYYVK